MFFSSAFFHAHTHTRSVYSYLFNTIWAFIFLISTRKEREKARESERHVNKGERKLKGQGSHSPQCTYKVSKSFVNVIVECENESQREREWAMQWAHWLFKLNELGWMARNFLLCAHSSFIQKVNESLKSTRLSTTHRERSKKLLPPLHRSLSQQHDD